MYFKKMKKPSTPYEHTSNKVPAVVVVVAVTMMKSGRHDHHCLYSYFILANFIKSICTSKSLISINNHRKKNFLLFKGFFSKFSVYWACDDNCCSVLLNDRVLSLYKIRSSFFPAFYFFTQLRGSKKIITNNASRMVQLMLIYTTN